jgi:hypothetical protein
MAYETMRVCDLNQYKFRDKDCNYHAGTGIGRLFLPAGEKIRRVAGV